MVAVVRRMLRLPRNLHIKAASHKPSKLGVRTCFFSQAVAQQRPRKTPAQHIDKFSTSEGDDPHCLLR